MSLPLTSFKLSLRHVIWPISSLIHCRRFWSWPGLTKALRLRLLPSPLMST